jgi:hypothetical protein
VSEMSLLREVSTSGAMPLVNDESLIDADIVELDNRPKRKRIVSYWPFLLIGLSLAATLLWLGILVLLCRALIATI